MSCCCESPESFESLFTKYIENASPFFELTGLYLASLFLVLFMCNIWKKLSSTRCHAGTCISCDVDTATETETDEENVETDNGASDTETENVDTGNGVLSDSDTENVDTGNGVDPITTDTETENVNPMAGFTTDTETERYAWNQQRSDSDSDSRWSDSNTSYGITDESPSPWLPDWGPF